MASHYIFGWVFIVIIAVMWIVHVGLFITLWGRGKINKKDGFLATGFLSTIWWLIAMTLVVCGMGFELLLDVTGDVVAEGSVSGDVTNIALRVASAFMIIGFFVVIVYARRVKEAERDYRQELEERHPFIRNSR